eukprot:g19822.t1
MTSNSSAGFVASASSNSAQAYLAFDSDFSTLWGTTAPDSYSGNNYTAMIETMVDNLPVSGAWLQLDLPMHAKVTAYHFTSAGAITAPRDWCESTHPTSLRRLLLRLEVASGRSLTPAARYLGCYGGCCGQSTNQDGLMGSPGSDAGMMTATTRSILSLLCIIFIILCLAFALPKRSQFSLEVCAVGQLLFLWFAQLVLAQSHLPCNEGYHCVQGQYLIIGSVFITGLGLAVGVTRVLTLREQVSKRELTN